MNNVKHGSMLDNQRGCSQKFQDPAQRFLAVQLANADISPRSSSPAFRVLGAFGLREEALLHIKRVNNTTAQYTSIICETHNFFVVINNYANATPEYQQQHSQALLERDAGCKQSADAEFARRRLSSVGKQVVTKNPKPPEKSLEKSLEEPLEEPPEEKSNVGTDGAIMQNLMVPNQNFAVVSFLNHNLEPCVQIHGVCTAVDTAEQFTRSVVAHRVKDQNIVTVDMYQWIHPTAFFKHKSDIPTTYRDSAQNDIMIAEEGREAHICNFKETETLYNITDLPVDLL